MSEGHARLGPSNTRWPHCPGSVREESKYPDISGDAAIDGTGSHLLLELCLKNNVKADAYEGQIIGTNHHDLPAGWLIHEDRITRVNMCLDYITRRHEELGNEYPNATITVESETKSDPGGMFGRTDWWGTVDITITVRNAMTGECLFIEIIDYKDGKGWVAVENNTQLISYMAGKLRKHIASGPDLVRPFRLGDVKGCRTTIVQPKTNPVVRSDMNLTVSEVIRVANELSLAAQATDKPDAPLIPDDKNGKGYCRWCKHKQNCNAQMEKSLTMVNNMTNDVIVSNDKSLFEYVNNAISNLKSLSNDQLAELADAGPGILAAFDKVNKEIEERIETGQCVPGYAMVPGNDKQVYTLPDEDIAKALRGRKMKKDDIYPAKLITPAALMKSDALTNEQKESFSKKYITKIASDKQILKRVTRDASNKNSKDLFKDVVQCQTNDLQSPVTFDQVQTENKISFM